MVEIFCRISATPTKVYATRAPVPAAIGAIG
jgi:hypothetical protein